ncbi:Glycoside hydrolase [Phytophthora cinnamomi]|uniref:Glycoside hydrolase n=1 Tax=Phytophthora cinnamomi TaxID=4785 RepID=UPI00355946B1|nr:Glycoside hydrolase [Phytophthora cinnamomi]
MDPDTSSSPPEPADIVPDTQVRRLSTTTDPFELFEEARSLSGAYDAHARSGRDSDASSERMDRIEGLLEGMAAKFAAQQLQMQT